MPWKALKTKNNSKTCQANENDALIEAVAWKCSVRKGILRNFSKFTGNHLCQAFFNKVVGLSLQLYKKRDFGDCFCNYTE